MMNGACSSRVHYSFSGGAENSVRRKSINNNCTDLHAVAGAGAAAAAAAEKYAVAKMARNNDFILWWSWNGTDLKMLRRFPTRYVNVYECDAKAELYSIWFGGLN